ncbi:MAG: DUF885 domain-containing protein [Acidobacteria bacterium]|nr:DUF885 domain-containing protein [Acidobacteriota bacterium]
MAEPFQHFVDDYLTYLYEAHPTSATLDGIHVHDDLLDDLSKTALDTHSGALAGFARRLDAIPSAPLSAIDQIEHRIVRANIESRQFDADRIRPWERDPHLYGQTLAASLATQAIFTFAPETDRARRLLSKLRQVPRLVQAARDNIKDPPAIFVKTGIDTFRGVVTFIDSDLPRAFSGLDDMHLLADLADASTEATMALSAYADYLETEVRPKAKASFRLGKERFERKLTLDEGLSLSCERLLTIAERELGRVQEEFRTVAAKLGFKDPMEAWQKVKQAHPAPGTLIQTVREQVNELRTFLERSGVVAVPNGHELHVAASPEFLRWSTASIWMPGPFETRQTRSTYYLTDALRSWPEARQLEHLRDLNLPTLWSISMHEVFPGHFLHFQHLRTTESKVRRSTLLAPISYIEGWAHYAEQMMVEAGFGRDDGNVHLGQLAESLVRLARLVVGIKLHADDWSVEQGVRFFQNEAYLEESHARREAERGTFDPSYVVYAAGKLMLLKLRQDWQDQQHGKPSLRAFHDAFLSHGSAPFWALRALMLGAHADDVLE